MPDTTNHLLLRYPTLDDVVTAVDYQNLASDIDAQLTVTDGLRQLNLHRPSVSASATAQTVVVATTTNLLFATNSWSVPSTFHSTVTNTDQFVVPTAGLYFVSASAQTFLITTATSVTVGITLNGTAQYQGSEAESGAIVTNLKIDVKGLILCQAGDILRVTGRWTGTGTGQMSGDVVMFSLAQP